MATRNLTMHFIRARAAAQNSRPTRFDNFSDSDSHLTAGPGSGYDTARLAAPTHVPNYVNDVDEINLAIETIQTKLAALKRAHTERLRVTFDQKESEKDQEIDILTQQISERFNFAGAKLQRVISKANSNKLDAESKIKKNIQRSLASKLQSLSQEFRVTQKTYLSQLKHFKDGSSLDDLLGPGSSGSGAAARGPGEIDTGFSDMQQQHMYAMEDLAQERDEEIMKIVTSVEELATVFKELAAMVIDQGTIIDRIDYNMEQTVLKVDKGIEELQKAQKHQASSRPMKCMILLVVLIVIMLIVLFVRKV